MNKKGEALTISMIVIIALTISILYLEFQTQKNYVADIQKEVVYNLRSESKSCDFSNITIEKEDIRLFETFEEAKEHNPRFRRSIECP